MAAKAAGKPSDRSITDGVATQSPALRPVSEELVSLLRRGNASTIKRWLKSGGNVNQVLHAPQLDKAWGYAPPAAASASLSASASPASAGAAPSTPPSTTSFQSHQAKALAAAGLPAQVCGHWPLLLLACTVGSAGVVEALLKAGADPNVRNLYGLTTLVAAIHNDALAAKEKLVLLKLLHRHGFRLFGAACHSPLGERTTAVSALMHQLAVADPDSRAAAEPLLDWLLQHESPPSPADPPAFQHLCFALALDPGALRACWLPLLRRRTAYVPGSPAFAELVVGVVAAAHQLREAREAAEAAQTPAGGGGSGGGGVAAASPHRGLDLGPDLGLDLDLDLGRKPPLGSGSSPSSRWEKGASRTDDDTAHPGDGPGWGGDASGIHLSEGGGKAVLAAAGDTDGPVAAKESPGSPAAAAAVAAGRGASQGGAGVARKGAGGSSSAAAGRPGGGAATGRDRDRDRERVSERTRHQGANGRGRAAGAAARGGSASVAGLAGRGGAEVSSDQANEAPWGPSGDGAPSGEEDAEEEAVLRAFLACGLDPNVPMCADGLLPMQRFLERPALLGVLLEGGMDPRIRAGTPPLDLTFLHSYALIGRFQSCSDASVQACALLLSRDPALLWQRCAGLTAFELALAHSNLALAEYLAGLMGAQQQAAASRLRQSMLGLEPEQGPGPALPAPPAAAGVFEADGQPPNPNRGEDDGEAKAKADDDNVARRVWDPASPAAAAAAVAAAAACGPVAVAGQSGELASSYRLICLALQRPELWVSDMSALMRGVPLMDIRQILTLLEVLNSPNLFNVVTYLEHCRTFAQRVILPVLQLGTEGQELMAAVVPPAAVASAVAFLRANPENLWLQSVAKYFPPVVDAMVASEDTRALMLVAPQRLLDRAAEVSRLPPDLVQAACECARAAMLLENGFHSPGSSNSTTSSRPQLDDLKGPLRRYAEVGYHRLLLRLLLALPAASKQVWHDLHVMAYLPEVCAEVALQLCSQPRLTSLVAEAAAVVRACMAGHPASQAKRQAAAAAAAVTASGPESSGAAATAHGDNGSNSLSAVAAPASYDEAVEAVVAHLAAHLHGMGAATPPPPAAPASAPVPADQPQGEPLPRGAAPVASAAAEKAPGDLAPSPGSDSSSSVISISSSGSPGDASDAATTSATTGDDSSSAPSTGQSSPARAASPPLPSLPDDAAAVTGARDCADGSGSGSAASPACAVDAAASAAGAPPTGAEATAIAAADGPGAEDSGPGPGPAAASPAVLPPELVLLEEVVVEQTDLLHSLYSLMALCSLCSHLLCPDFGLAMCSPEFRTRISRIPDSAVDELAAKHTNRRPAPPTQGATAAATAGSDGGAAAAAPAAPPAPMSPSSAAAATAAAILAAYPTSGGLSLDQLYAQLLGNLSNLGAEQKELVESRREFLKQVLAMDATWKALPRNQPQPQPQPLASSEQQLAAAPAAEAAASDQARASASAISGPQPPTRDDAPPDSSPSSRCSAGCQLRDTELVERARRAVLTHPVIWPTVRAVAALPAAPGPRPGVRVVWDDDNTPIYVLMSLAARRAVALAESHLA